MNTPGFNLSSEHREIENNDSWGFVSVNTQWNVGVPIVGIIRKGSCGFGNTCGECSKCRLLIDNENDAEFKG
jgi:hypothetical protein